MTTIVRLSVENASPGEDRWAMVASAIRMWGEAHSVVLRDAVVLLPFAQLLPVARRAFARAGGWMPRIETTKTLSAGLGPAPTPEVGQITFEPTIDSLTAVALLRSRPWGAAWAKRDLRGFEQAARALVSTAQALARAAAAVVPAERAAYWVRAQGLLAPLPGPGAAEHLLAWEALVWASQAPPPATDRLFDLASPSAWIAVQAGGPDSLATRLLAQARAPSLLIDADAIDDDPFADIAAHCLPTFAICESFEHEAQCAAAQIVDHIAHGDVPVALIAQDRVLVRRVRALLEREHVRLLDETGWKLSTTRAAAQVMTLLRAARDDASTNALLDWLKAGASWTTHKRDREAVSALEAICRRESISNVPSLRRLELKPEPARVLDSAITVLDGLSSARRQTLPAWLQTLSIALKQCNSMEFLQIDSAGQQVIDALHLSNSSTQPDAWADTANRVVMDLDAFRAWVDDVLEQATFVPSAMFDEPAQVVITPMARAILRPFAAVVFPGADDRRLGAPPGSDTLLTDAQAEALGVPTSANRRRSELLAFVHTLAAPKLAFMRRRVDGNEPLSDSPLIERLSLAWAARGQAMQQWRDPRVDREIESTPIRMPAPSASQLLPARLSASACEALRACPYRFFALNMLRLREEDELEREIEKRDYGTWLHEVLLEFHTQRESPLPVDMEVETLMRMAAASQSAQDIADADFLPFSASFAVFAPRYIAWLHKRDREGAQWLRGETAVSLALEKIDGIELHGVIDRADQVMTSAGSAMELIDYKTGSSQSLKAKVKEPLEDTQLAFYAALMLAQTELPLKAGYLALDGSKGIDSITHPNVETSAILLVDGLVDDLRRLRGGAGLPALGEGSTCSFCAARGVCRRDHWSEDSSNDDLPAEARR